MEKAERRKSEFEALFAHYALEPDYKFLSENFGSVPDYEWKGFLNSINAILSRRQRQTARN